MINERIFLREDDEKIYLDTFVANTMEGFTRSAMLVIPGGGYGSIAPREGEPIAEAFMPYGFNTFVLRYTVAKKRPYPAQLVEASLAIKHIKDNAEKYGIDKDKIFVVGFSAGAHLAGCLATMWHREEVYAEAPMPFGYNKPTGAILCYPVVNGIESAAHTGSFKNLLCTDTPTDEQLDYTSVDKAVDENTSPIFMMHTSNDELVNVKNSLCLASALRDANKQFELHIFPDAPHGVALGNEITECGNEKWNNKRISEWVRLAAEWTKTL